MSSARIVLPSAIESLLRPLPTLFTLLTLGIAGAYVLPSAGGSQAPRARPALVPASALTRESIAQPLLYVAYIVETDQDAYDFVAKLDDAYAPDVLTKGTGSWSRSASVVSLPGLHYPMVVVVAPEQEEWARQLLAASGLEIAASGGTLEVVDLRNAK